MENIQDRPEEMAFPALLCRKDFRRAVEVRGAGLRLVKAFFADSTA